MENYIQTMVIIFLILIMIYFPNVSRFLATSFFIVSTLAVVVNPSSGVFIQ